MRLIRSITTRTVLSLVFGLSLAACNEIETTTTSGLTTGGGGTTSGGGGTTSGGGGTTSGGGGTTSGGGGTTNAGPGGTCTGGSTTIPGGTTDTTINLNTGCHTYVLGGDLVAAGTAFRISANDVILDLGGHTLTYNGSSQSSSVYGVYVPVGVDRITVMNGTILQGDGASTNSPAIYVYGANAVRGPNKIHDLVIRAHGYQSRGIVADQGYGFNNGEIYRNYIEILSGTTALDGFGANAIEVNAMNTGGVQIHDNIIVASHQGIGAARLGEQMGQSANRSNIYNNLIQQERREGSKAPYGIALAGQTHNTHVYDNQIISDNGRGIIFDGNGQGVTDGVTGNSVYRNRIDVQYSSTATSGAYVENNIYGLRDRYGSGDNIWENNIVMVENGITGPAYGVYFGSDLPDPAMVNLVIRQNTFIVRQGAGGGVRMINQWDYAESLSFTDNKYIGTIDSNSSRITSYTESGNTPLSPAVSATIGIPTGVRITRFLDSYLIQWNLNFEPDVYEYVVYRDGQPLPVSPRGGTFYVDRGIGGTHTYAVAAKTLDGRVGNRSVDISTSTAANGWQ